MEDITMENNMYTENQVMENQPAEKTRCTAGIVLGIIAIVIGILFVPIVGVGCGIAGIIVCISKKEVCKIKVPLILSIIGLLGSAGMWLYSFLVIMPQLEAMMSAMQ